MGIVAKSMTLSGILGDSDGISVPWYQRSYKWERKQIEEVFDDVLLFFGRNEGQSAFLGSIVFCPGESGDDEIVDGQQRITTLCVMISLIASKILELDPQSSVASTAYNLLRRSDGITPKLIHKDEDKVIFKEIVAAQPGGLFDYLNHAEKFPPNKVMDARMFVKDKNIYLAKNIVEGMIVQAVDEACEQRSITKLVSLTQLLNVFLKQVNLVQIKTDTHMDGIRIFEALNATGMPLEIYELVKSSFYMQAAALSTKARDKVRDTWEQTSNSVCSVIEKSSDINQFLRVYWMSRFGLVAKNRLFDSYSEYIGNLVSAEGENALILECSKLTSAVECYNLMVKETGQFACLSVQNHLGAVIYRAPMLAVWLNSGLTGAERSEAFKRVSMVLESVLVRMSICGQTTNSVDKAFAAIAHKISKGEMGSTPTKIEENVRNYLRDSSHQIPSDDIFYRSILDVNVKLTQRRWRSFLIKINNVMKYPNEASYKFAAEISDLGLKFIFAPFKKPSPHQVSLHGFKNESEYIKTMSSIGNILVISKSSGKQLSDPINYHTATNKENCKVAIENRSTQLAKVAVKIWTV